MNIPGSNPAFWGESALKQVVSERPPAGVRQHAGERGGLDGKGQVPQRRQRPPVGRRLGQDVDQHHRHLHNVPLRSGNREASVTWPPTVAIALLQHSVCSEQHVHHCQLLDSTAQLTHLTGGC
jgi:hypothetical protein